MHVSTMAFLEEFFKNVDVTLRYKFDHWEGGEGTSEVSNIYGRISFRHNNKDRWRDFTTQAEIISIGRPNKMILTLRSC